ncbi:RluA family pseudouridine synthase [Provencibacterium massiliense]|uniref:RluA family pseudouridine synthase n=1 Tax=Provencibacterium massiliense TaxID=1841868 RepID=UPI00135643B1|nr:RluA family pseudouridine synthase [Provencibacterium massiliense]
MRELHFTIEPGYDSTQVKTYLRRQLGFSNRTVTKLKQHPLGLRRNGEHVRTVDLLRAGDTLSVAFCEEERAVLCSNRRVEILYEDEDLMVYNKPPGMPVHTSCGHASDTLENVYAAHCLRAGAPGRLRALNRLDRDTSGCVLVAKNQYAASRLTGNFEKSYRALVCGELRGDGRVEAKIYRPDPVDIRRTVDERGQVSITEYGVLQTGNGYSFLQFRLLTGRTHQIRVHMAYIGHPVLGDPMYGSGSELIGRQALHCWQLRFTHPVSGERLCVTAPLPEDMREAYARSVGAK